MKIENTNPESNYNAYVGKIASIENIEGADNIVKAVVNSVEVVVGKDMQVGELVIMFPSGSTLNPFLLENLNLYSQSELNKDVTKKGYFGKNGLVKTKKLRNVYSDCLVLPVSSLYKVFQDNIKETQQEFENCFLPYLGKEINYINDIWLCKKLEIEVDDEVDVDTLKSTKKSKKKRKIRVPEQFRFHYDTAHLEPHLDMFFPDTEVNISVKLHGTSGIIANYPSVSTSGNTVIDKMWKYVTKFLSKFGLKNFQKNVIILSSRKVIQSTSSKDGRYYPIYEALSQFVPENWTIYGEMVGYYRNGSCIQTLAGKEHDYGCVRGECKFVPYRITIWNGENKQFEEMSPTFVHDWTVNLIKQNPTLKEKIMPLTIVYQGKLQDLYPDLPTLGTKFVGVETIQNFLELWRTELLKHMKNDTKLLGMEKSEPLCHNKGVPREGVVIKICENTHQFLAFASQVKPFEAFKLKTIAHKKAESIDLDAADN